VCLESEPSRRDGLLSRHTVRWGGGVQAACLPTRPRLEKATGARLDERIVLISSIDPSISGSSPVVWPCSVFTEW